MADACTDPRLLYRKDDVLIVLKEAGFVCAQFESKGSEGIGREFCLSDYWQELLNTGRLYCVHRLDRVVTGACLMASSHKAGSTLSALFASRGGVRKTYWAIAEGVLPQTEDFTLLSHRLLFDTRTRRTRVFPSSHTSGKEALLEWRCIGTGERYSFLEIKLLTGRTHQIRAQLAASGIHIKGDVKYGAKRQDSLPGIRLHARSLEFVHSHSSLPVRVYAPLPHRDNLWDAFCKCAGGV